LLTRHTGEDRQGLSAARNLAYATEVAARLDRTRAAAPSQSLPDLCDGYWDPANQRRERSPQLAADHRRLGPRPPGDTSATPQGDGFRPGR
jgi:hypothetical protein